MDHSMVRKLLEEALEELLVQSRHLLETSSSERSITADLTWLLRKRLGGWHVNAEYNRNHYEVKRLLLKKIQLGQCASCRSELDTEWQMELVQVVPDVIVHRQGTDENLLVIEAKKHTATSEDLERDRNRLDAFVRQLGYEVGALVVFGVGERPSVTIAYWVEKEPP